MYDIPEGEELCYDCGDRSGGDWMRQGRLVDGMVVAGAGDTAVKEVAKGVAVPQTAPKRKKPHRNLYYCPLPECFEKACMEKIANHVHQYHNLHGEEAHRVLRRKKLATAAQAREHLKKKRPETGSGDIRTMFSGPTPAGRVSEGMAASVVGKGKGKGKEKRKGKGKEKRKGKGKGNGKEKGKGKGKVQGKGKAGSGLERKRMGMPEDQEAREGNESDSSEASLSHRSGTRHMGKHTGPLFDSFDAFLKARVGGKKSDRCAKGIVVNVAKYLYWCDASSVDPVYLLKARKIREYIEGLEAGLEAKVGPSGLQLHICDIEF